MFTEECAYAGGDEEERPRREAAVLIVEDERVARRALRALLNASGYATEAAESAEQALHLLQGGAGPRVALVDLNLPGMNGIDLIRRLEELDPSIRPVLRTAAGDEALAEALSQRAVPYVRKPLDFPRLLALLPRTAGGGTAC